MEANFCLSLPVQLGAYQLLNRIVIASNPRCQRLYEEQSQAHIHLLQSEAITYYSNLASCGLIITEPTSITPLDNLSDYPGIYTREQLHGWRNITEAVREQDGKIFVQLWHRKRTKRSDNNERVEIINLFRRAAQNALAAEFDGVEINFQVDSFSDHTKCITDNYSYELENYIQLLLSIVEEVAGIWDANKVGIKITSKVDESRLQIFDLNSNFYYLLDAIDFNEIAFLHLGNRISTKFCQSNLILPLLNLLHSMYSGKVIISCQDGCAKEINAIANSSLDMISLNNLSEIISH
ncbi:MAG: hypothetical protein AAGF83_03015 [Cyanobacteria bacterium P01_G01_bin.67]